MWKRINAFLKVVVLIFLVFSVAALWVVWRQGVQEDSYNLGGNAKVTFDQQGIPTVSAPDWPSLLEAQGYVVASERMFQMDLTRRKASGRLSELFGEKAFPLDSDAQSEGRLDVAAKAASLLPKDESDACNSFAKGVNKFIAENSWNWGIEYVLLGARPLDWTCADSLLVVLAMSETLTAYGPSELKQWHWKSKLDPSWVDFLYPQNHPWNVPMFGTKSAGGAPIPDRSKYIPMAALVPNKQAAVKVGSDAMAGSNSWAWNGKSGAFLVNDPHLGQSVPGVWYAMRLKISNQEWVVGAALPGLPGIILGMNSALAWGFTNTGEDVDDYLSEKISPDGKSYLASKNGEEEVWEPIEVKAYPVKVKGEPDRIVTAKFTRRGPLIFHDDFGGKAFSRQWLALRPEALRLPVTNLNRSRNWAEFNQAIDGLRLPAQNILVVDRAGNIGYRLSGTGVIRKSNGKTVESGLDGEWLGLAEPNERRRDWVEADPNSPTFKATANQRIWVDDMNHSWASDDRVNRINEVLRSKDNFTSNSMLELQLDTEGRFRRILLNWIANNADLKAERSIELAKNWHGWNGSSVANPIAFTQSIDAETELLKILLGRVRDTYLKDLKTEQEYSWYMKRAWITTLIEMKDGMNVFGFTDKEIANHLLYLAETKATTNPEAESFEQTNRWHAQHPFKNRIPVIGRFFGVKEHQQFGYSDLVRAESKMFGPSIRLIFNTKDPASSLWNQQVGQSGHLRSRYFRNLQKSWFAGEAHKVFPSNEDWGFQTGT